MRNNPDFLPSKSVHYSSKMSRQPNYKLKAAILIDNLHVIVKNYDFLDWSKVDFLKGLDIEREFNDLVAYCGPKVIKECRRVYQASYKRVQRLRNRIRSYLESGQCIFLTLEFSPDVLAATTYKTRRKYVSLYLKSISNQYVANIDFGGLKCREHYHAVVLCDWVDLQWPHGYMYRQKIHRTNSDIKLSKYISKLTNHAIKESTKRSVYIYSRN